MNLRSILWISALVVLAPTDATAQGDDKPTTARMVFYSGDVQGVGFRLTSVRISRDYAVTGWVKNLKDGRVQLLAEGSDDAVDKFLQAVRTHFKKNIEKEETDKRTPTGKYKKFDVEQ